MIMKVVLLIRVLIVGVGTTVSVQGFVGQRQSPFLTTTASSNVLPSPAALTWSLLGASGGLFGDDIRKDRNNDQVSSSADNNKKKFAAGDELKRLRADLKSLRDNLQWAQAMDDLIRMQDLQKAIDKGEQKDPELVYRKALRMIAESKASNKLSPENKQELIEKWQKEAKAARACLPQFQMEGLWVGT